MSYKQEDIMIVVTMAFQYVLKILKHMSLLQGYKKKTLFVTGNFSLPDNLQV